MNGPYGFNKHGRSEWQRYSNVVRAQLIAPLHHMAQNAVCPIRDLHPLPFYLFPTSALV